MKLEFEWLDAPGVHDPLLAATWARLEISVDGQIVSELIDPRSAARRTGIYGPLFPLVEWLVENWWQLAHEPSPVSPVPSGRQVDGRLRTWLRRHNFLAARDGGALPDFTVARDGDKVALRWELDPGSGGPARVRSIGQGSAVIAAEQFISSTSCLVEAVLARLEERASDTPGLRRLQRLWHEIRSADADEKELCRLLATLGVDPYDPDEATDDLVDLVESTVRVLPNPLRQDVFDDAEPDSLASVVEWVRREGTALCESNGHLQTPIVEPPVAATAHETGYEAARRVRTEVFRITPDEPLPNLVALAVDRLGWTPEATRAVDDMPRLDGLVGIDRKSDAPVLIAPKTRFPAAERFRLARAVCFLVTGGLRDGARGLTPSVTWPQRVTRAFAAELLAPSSGLEKRVRGSVSEVELDELAAEFNVDPRLIQHQLQNHHIAFVAE